MARDARVVPMVEIPGSEARRRGRLQEGASEVLITLLSTIAFGLGWAAIEAGQANSALARDGIPATAAVEIAIGTEAGPAKAATLWAGTAAGAETGYARARMERR